MTRRSTFAAAVLGTGLLWGAASAQAALISRIFTVDVPFFPGGLPTLQFQISFDNAASISDTTNGITLLNSALSLDSPLGFTYSQAADALTVGGMADGVTSINIAGGADFYIILDDVTGKAVYKSGLYSTGAGRGGYISGIGSVTVSAVPEPATLGLLLAAAAAGLAASRRAARRTTAPAAPGSR